MKWKWMNALVVFVFALVVFANKEHFIAVAADETASELAVRYGVSNDHIQKRDLALIANKSVPTGIGTKASNFSEKEIETKKMERTEINNVEDNERLNDGEVDVEKDVYLVKIRYGMGSRDVSALMHEIGFLENSKEFASYLMDNGYSKRIQIGEYKITKNMTFKDIANLITTK